MLMLMPMLRKANSNDSARAQAKAMANTMRYALGGATTGTGEGRAGKTDYGSKCMFDPHSSLKEM